MATKSIGRPAVLALFVSLVILGLIAHVFLRCFIEEGEERFWLIVYLIVVPIVAGLGCYFLAPFGNFWIRITSAIVAVIFLFFFVYWIPRLADVIGAGGLGRTIYPPLVRAESFYLALLNYDQDHRMRHENKVANVNLAKALSSCDEQTVLGAISDLEKRRLLGSDFTKNAIDHFVKSDRCNDRLRKIVRSRWGK